MINKIKPYSKILKIDIKKNNIDFQRKFSLKAIEGIINNNENIIHLNNGQGALIQNGKTKIFSSIYNQNKNLKITELNNIYNITSHGYFTCAEVTGFLKDGSKFYIHSLNENNLNDILENIINDSGQEPESINIKADFNYNQDNNIEKKYIEVVKNIGFSKIYTEDSSPNPSEII